MPSLNHSFHASWNCLYYNEFPIHSAPTVTFVLNEELTSKQFHGNFKEISEQEANLSVHISGQVTFTLLVKIAIETHYYSIQANYKFIRCSQTSLASSLYENGHVGLTTRGDCLIYYGRQTCQ